MGTGGGRISLPLGVGVDRGHPSGRIYLSFFFFLVVRRRDKNGHWGWLDVSPLAVGVDRGHSQWPDLFFFFGFAGKVVGDGGGWRRLFAGGGRWVAVSGHWVF
jgi:hypothetical protein